MLDSITKKKIDDARDILVGKVPVPSSQVEQITVALIYKFMYDMDNESIDLGGNPKYFTGDFAPYAWNKLFDQRLSGEGRVTLYQDALAKIPNNASIPGLFRDIFKNAFLPYRDPETLRLFLRCIDEFTYDHSEKLGDAFEYLLAVLGSQGDAGQFRTPRHIIDFMVELIDPQKEDSILDPACGTAGFLISAYKHVIKTNSSNYSPATDPHTFATHGTPLDELVIQNGKKYQGDLLTPDQRAFIHNNLKGYDIAFEMVRLSLVNMYLHGFNTPQIYEYDTLTRTERWNEYANVILANPPFMSPKGGIKPHQRFSIQAKRSEVLFVDYMLSHLTNNGRAAIIVPEGIIFQSGNAYKQLRKLLVEEDFLVGVISLPGGVFNPYSGVKTSILWIDKALAKRSDKVIFLKVNNDGFDLGAKRNPIDSNDFPAIFDLISKFKMSIMLGSESTAPNDLFMIVSKREIKSKSDYTLSAEKYRVINTPQNLHQVIDLKEVLTEGSQRVAGKDIRVWSVSNEKGFVNSSDYFERSVASKDISNYKIVPPFSFAYNPSRINVGSIAYNKSDIIGAVSPMYTVFSCNSTELNGDFLLYVLKSEVINKEINRRTNGSIRAQLRFSDLCNIRITMPSIEVQEELVAELDLYQKIIDGAKQVVSNWKPGFELDQEWARMRFGEICSVSGNVTYDIDPEGIYIGADSIEPNTGKLMQRKSIKEQGITGPVYHFSGKKLLYSKLRPYLNKLCIVDFEGFCSSDMYPLTFTDAVKLEYARYYLLSDEFLKSIENFQNRARIPKINREQLFSLSFPLPDLDTQEEIIRSLEVEEKLVESSRRLIQIYEKKIKDRIAKLWNS